MANTGTRLRKFKHLIRVQHKWFQLLSYNDLHKWLKTIGLKQNQYRIYKVDGGSLVVGLNHEQDVADWTKKFRDWGGNVGVTFLDEFPSSNVKPAATWEDFAKDCKQYEASR